MNEAFPLIASYNNVSDQAEQLIVQKNMKREKQVNNHREREREDKPI